MGSEETLTIQGKKAAENADLIIGAKRLADAVCQAGKPVFYEYRSNMIAEYIQAHPEYENIVIALSGDVGFYSGAKKLLEAIRRSYQPEESNVEVICGISSVVYFMSKIGLSWDDAKITSAHGKNCNLISMIRENPKVVFHSGNRGCCGKAGTETGGIWYGRGIFVCGREPFL